MRPNCVTGTFPRNCSAGVALRLYTFFQSVYSARGTPYFPIQIRNTPAAAQIVSSFPIRACVSLVASSTMSIRQPRGPRASNQSWKLPSTCTSSPKGVGQPRLVWRRHVATDDRAAHPFAKNAKGWAPSVGGCAGLVGPVGAVLGLQAFLAGINKEALAAEKTHQREPSFSCQ